MCYLWNVLTHWVTTKVPSHLLHWLTASCMGHYCNAEIPEWFKHRESDGLEIWLWPSVYSHAWGKVLMYPKGVYIILILELKKVLYFSSSFFVPGPQYDMLSKNICHETLSLEQICLWSCISHHDSYLLNLTKKKATIHFFLLWNYRNEAGRLEIWSRLPIWECREF